MTLTLTLLEEAEMTDWTFEVGEFGDTEVVFVPVSERAKEYAGFAVCAVNVRKSDAELYAHQLQSKGFKLEAAYGESAWERRVRELEAEGMSRSDAQAVADAECV